MGNAVNNARFEPEEITDEKWSKQLEKYLEIEDPEVEADLIYHFDGKTVSGEQMPCNLSHRSSLSMRIALKS
jgi:hypothetical protein